MGTVPLAGLLVVSAVLIILSMLFSISESSFLAMNKLRLRVLRGKKDRRALRAGKLLEKKEILINTLLVANDLVNILLSSILTAAALALFGERGVGIATFVVTILLLVFGEITPKTLSTRNPDGIAYALSLFVDIVVKILRPVVFLFTLVSRLVLKIRGISIENPKQSYTEEDIKSFIAAGSETGILENGEKNMMNRVFKFKDLEAQDIMVPRTSIIALQENASYAEVIELAQRTRLSHFPVYRKNLDDITGVLYLKDLLKVSEKAAAEGVSEEAFFNLKNVMRQPLFIPGTNKISSVQQQLRENHQSFAVVIDEYSGTDGILTKEDICREIFGTSENSKPWRNNTAVSEFAGKKSFSIEGSTLLVDLKELLGITLHSNINETLGGWIIEQLGRLAVPYDSVTAEGFAFTVEAVYMRRVKTVTVKKTSETADDNE